MNQNELPKTSGARRLRASVGATLTYVALATIIGFVGVRYVRAHKLHNGNPVQLQAPTREPSSQQGGSIKQIPHSARTSVAITGASPEVLGASTSLDNAKIVYVEGRPGPQGLPGAQGPQGEQGIPGPQGPAGSSSSSVSYYSGIPGSANGGGSVEGVTQLSAQDLTVTNNTVTNSLQVTGSFSTLGASITGGAIDSTPIGSSSPSTGAFTTINGSSLTLNSALTVANGGTGLNTLTPDGVLFGNGTSALQETAAPTAGQLLLGNTSGVPSFTTLSGDATISSTGVITLKNTGTAGSYGSASSVPVFVTDAQGRVTGVTNTSIAISASQITSGQLPIASGGTNGTAVPIAGAIAYGTGSIYAFSSAGTANQLLASGGTGTPIFQNIASLLTTGNDINISGTTNATIAVSNSPTFGTSATTPIIYGGTGASSTLTLAGTSNGTPSNAYILLNPSGQGKVGIGTATPSATLDVVGTVRGAILDKGGQVFNAEAYGMKCDDSTDDTAAFTALLTTVYNAGGGTIYFPAMCLVNNFGTIPNSGDPTTPTQPYIRLTGSGQSTSGYRNISLPTPAGLDLRYNAPVAKIDTRGVGVLEIDHITLKDGGSDCAPFIQTTNTVLDLHDISVIGTASGTSACNDVAIFGGTTTTQSGASNAPFQGYGSVMERVIGSNIRRLALLQQDANGIVIQDNTVLNGGSSLTTPIASCTNASPVVCTIANSTDNALPFGSTATFNLSGFTGNWTPLNGAQTVTSVTNAVFSIAINSTGFGSMTGTPGYLTGAAIELDDGDGNTVAGNLIELSNYAYGIYCSAGSGNDTVTGNNLYDPTANRTIGGNYFKCGHSTLIEGNDDVQTTLSVGRYDGTDSVISRTVSSFNAIANPGIASSELVFAGTGGVPLGSANLTFDNSLMRETITSPSAGNGGYVVTNDVGSKLSMFSYGSTFPFVASLTGNQGVLADTNLILVSGGTAASGGSSVISLRAGGYDTAAIMETISKNGVGIGTTSPSVELQVGNSSVSGTVAQFQNSSGTCSINPTTSTLSCSSDQRLKTNITSMSSALQGILALNPVTFNWLTEPSGTQSHPGFIAQQVQPIFPDVVSTDSNGYLSVGYSEFVPYIVSAMQAQEKEIQTLQSQTSSNVNGSVSVYSPSNFSGDSVGQAEILPGGTSVHVSFSTTYSDQPIVTATPLDFVSGAYRITDINVSGFTIETQLPVSEDTTFDWHSFASPQEELTVSDGSTQPIQALTVSDTSNQSANQSSAQGTQDAPIVSGTSESTSPDSNSSSASNAQTNSTSIPAPNTQINVSGASADGTPTNASSDTSSAETQSGSIDVSSPDSTTGTASPASTPPQD